MTDPILVLHLLAVGIWLGVIGAELFIEIDGMTDDPAFIKASLMHYRTDLWVEIPAFTVVLVTGLLMLQPGSLEGLLLYKVVFGVLAIVFNLVCVYAVFKRRTFALAGDVSGMHSTDRIMQIGGAGFIPCFVATLVLAAVLLAR